MSGPYVEQTGEGGPASDMITMRRDYLAALVAAAEERGAAKERERIAGAALRRAQAIDGVWVDPEGSRKIAGALRGFAHDIEHEGCQDSTLEHLAQYVQGAAAGADDARTTHATHAD